VPPGSEGVGGILPAGLRTPCPGTSTVTGPFGPSGTTGTIGVTCAELAAVAPPGGSQAGGGGENRSGLLPFTGFGLLVLAALAAGLIAGGLEARRAATGRSTPQG
jgi:hypothetical protein